MGKIEGKIEERIEIGRELNIPENVIMSQLMEKYNLSEEKAREYMKKI